jgi:hypothetical protein
MTACFDSSFSVSGDGSLTVSERGTQDDKGLWSSSRLVDTRIGDSQETSLMVSTCDESEEGDISFQASAHHIENPDTGRAFHGIVDVWLSWEQTQALRDYLNFLLSQRDDLTA